MATFSTSLKRKRSNHFVVDEEDPIIELVGQNFTNEFEIWFDSVPLATTFVNSRRLRGLIPSLNAVKPNWRVPLDTVSVHVNLVLKRNALCVATGMLFKFTPVELTEECAFSYEAENSNEPPCVQIN